MTEDKKNTLAKLPNFRLPCESTLLHASKLSILEDKPIMLDYWTPSLNKDDDTKDKALIGVKSKIEKLLVKNEEEYTSPIIKFFQNQNDFIIVTENSIYIIDSGIQSRMIS
jgi:hypothetical protein